MNNKYEEINRTPRFKRNSELELLLHKINDYLACAEKQAIADERNLGPIHPVVFIMGPLRCGSTLFTQWLAKTGLAVCPTNLLSRFYGAPVVGAQIQLLLTDPLYNFRNELLDFNTSGPYESENGKTIGALAPNEFWYFWRRFLPFGEIDWLSDEELFRVVDRQMLVAELTTLTRVFAKPFALKGTILNYNIPFLNALFAKALFIQIKRDPVSNVVSILEARKRQFGSEAEWYSFKIPEYPKLKKLDPVMQAVGQLSCINRAVERGMCEVSESRKFVVDYEDFCEDPSRIYDELINKLGGDANPYDGPDQFRVAKSNDKRKVASVARALDEFDWLQCNPID